MLKFVVILTEIECVCACACACACACVCVCVCVFSIMWCRMTYQFFVIFYILIYLSLPNGLTRY